MASQNQIDRLALWMNGERVGSWINSARAQPVLQYEASWLQSARARPLSLSLPFTPGNFPHKGEAVKNFFDNLLPDNAAIRKRLATKFNANSEDAFDLLQAIGRDCAGAIQLLPEQEVPQNIFSINGEALSDKDIERILFNVTYSGATVQNDPEVDFRISIAGAQEKTALLWHENRWQRPLGATPTTHIFKLPLGRIGNLGVDLGNSVENEWLCAQILQAFGLPVAKCDMANFGEKRVLIVERFDRRLSNDVSWITRLPQEDFCQALGISPWKKYESNGGPGIEAILKVLENSDAREQDRNAFYQTQILFWMLAAIDGHAKNFSLFLNASGSYRLTPFYDVLSAWPYVGKKSNQLQAKKIKLAMAVRSENTHYRLLEIQRRHWNAMARRCGLGLNAESLIKDLIEKTPAVIKQVSTLLPKNFPDAVAELIFKGLQNAADKLEAMEA